MKLALASSLSNAFLFYKLYFCFYQKTLMVSLMLPFPLPLTSAKGLVLSIPSFTHLSSCLVISIHTLLNLGQARRKKLSTLLCQTVNSPGWGLPLSHHWGSEAAVPHLTDGRPSVISEWLTQMQNIIPGGLISQAGRCSF